MRRGLVVAIGTVSLLGTMLLLATGPQEAARPPLGRPPATSAAPASSPASTGTPSTSEPGHGHGTPVVFDGSPAAAPAELASFYGQRASWRACPGEEQFECATVRVPVDYGKPSGSAVSIALRRVPATSPAGRKGTLFINPGGPGGSGIEMASAVPEFFDPRVLEVWDVVGFDPRGIGASGGFTCLTGRELDAIYGDDPTPDTASEVRRSESLASEARQACLRRGGQLAMHMSSDEVAKDLDVLRDAVGDERLNYYGVSYGTLIGARYAEHFPTRVGLMVLDSVVRPDPVEDAGVTQVDVDAYARGDAYNFDNTVDAFAENCRASVTCPLGADAKAVSSSIVRLLDGLASAPLPTDVDSLPRLTEGWAATAVNAGLGDESTWPDLTDALDLAIHEGDGTELAWIAMDAVGRDDDGSYPEGAVGNVLMPVMCADWRVTTWETMRPSKDVGTNHPLWARVADQHFVPCLGWRGPVRPDKPYSVDLESPVLVIGNEDDLTTPIEEAEALADLIGGARLVTVETGGHGAYTTGNDCADDTVHDYLVNATAPADDKRCEA